MFFNFIKNAEHANIEEIFYKKFHTDHFFF